MFETVTDFGDATLILPAALTLLAYLWTTGARRIALSFGASLALSMLLLILSKVCFRSCGAWSAALDIVSPSGHAAMATLFYGCGAMLLARGRSQRVQLALGFFAMALIAAVAISRIALGFHTGQEVAAGLSIGLIGLALFRAASPAASDVLPAPRAALAAFALIALLSHGEHIDAERWIAQLSSEFRGPAGVCTVSSPAPFLGPTARSS